MARLLPFFGAAFLMDAALYLTFAALPYRALELGAGSVLLGALPTLYAAAYMLSAAWGGRVSDRWPRVLLARRAALVFGAGALLLASAPSLLALTLALPCLGLALGFYWSPLQAALSDRAASGSLSQALGGFNIAWSLGKGTGIVLSGALTDSFSPAFVLALSAAPAIGASLLLRRAPAAVAGPADQADAVPSAPSSGKVSLGPAFLGLAWMANALAYGIVGTVNMHAPRWLLADGGGASQFGVLFGALFAVQTATFVALLRHAPRPGSLAASLGLAVVGLVALVVAPSFAARCLAVIPLGLATGLAYQASLYASVNRSEGRGKAAGLHEMLLGAGSSSLPLLGGLLVSSGAALDAPFWLAAGCGGLGLAVAAAFRFGVRRVR